MAVIIIIIGAVLFTYLINVAYSRLWNRNLEVVIDFKDDAVAEGEESELIETIVNRKWLFLPMLQVRFQTHKNLKFADGENVSVSDLCYKRDIFSVGSYQKITRTIRFDCRKRGFYEIESADLLTRSPLMTSRYYETIGQSTELYVYPKQIEYSLLEIVFQKIMGEVQSKKNIYEDHIKYSFL